MDIGYGGAAPIVESAICIDRVAAGLPWSGYWPVHLVWDCFSRLPFESESLDYVYSSHCLEDAMDTGGVLMEWCRVIRPEGYLVLFLPHQQDYLAYCQLHRTLPNLDHKHAYFNLSYVIAKLPNSMQVVHSQYPVNYNPYSFELVAQRGKI